MSWANWPVLVSSLPKCRKTLWGCQNHWDCWLRLPMISINSPPSKQVKTWFALFLSAFPSLQSNLQAKMPFKYLIRTLTLVVFPNDDKYSNFTLYVSNRYTMTLFSLYYYWHLGETVFQQIGFLFQPGHRKSICHLVQVENGVKPTKQGGCPKA